MIGAPQTREAGSESRSTVRVSALQSSREANEERSRLCDRILNKENIKKQKQKRLQPAENNA